MTQSEKCPDLEWTAEPVKHVNGSEWEGLLYINDGKRRHGSMNAEVAKGLIAAHNAALQRAVAGPPTKEDFRRAMERWTAATLAKTTAEAQLAAAKEELTDAQERCVLHLNALAEAKELLRTCKAYVNDSLNEEIDAFLKPNEKEEK